MLIIEKIYADYEVKADEKFVNKASDEFYSKAYELVKNDNFFELEGLVNSLTVAYEKQGFINGFKLAVKFMKECK